jgi:hypothetical protein
MGKTAVGVQEEPYKILLSVPVPYAVLNQQLQDTLFHQEVKLPTTFGNTLAIERTVSSMHPARRPRDFSTNCHEGRLDRSRQARTPNPFHSSIRDSWHQSESGYRLPRYN